MLIHTSRSHLCFTEYGTQHELIGLRIAKAAAGLGHPDTEEGPEDGAEWEPLEGEAKQAAETVAAALAEVFKRSNTDGVEFEEKPVGGADGWLIRWRLRRAGGKGDTSLTAPNGTKVPSVRAAKRYLGLEAPLADKTPAEAPGATRAMRSKNTGGGLPTYLIVYIYEYTDVYRSIYIFIYPLAKKTPAKAPGATRAMRSKNTGRGLPTYLIVYIYEYTDVYPSIYIFIYPLADKTPAEGPGATCAMRSKNTGGGLPSVCIYEYTGVYRSIYIFIYPLADKTAAEAPGATRAMRSKNTGGGMPTYLAYTYI